MDLLTDLQWRGLVKDVTDLEGLKERLKTPITLYCGFDPTADSLHIGHLQQIFLLRRYQMAGHNIIALCGGATAMVGDPRPTAERSLQTLEQIASNVTFIDVQLKKLLNAGKTEVIFTNNYEWHSKINILEFLRDYGKHFNVNYMINKDIVSSRLQTGISFTEFTYTILQSVDWLHLYENYNCEMQIGGSDQWGNLTSGTELIRKVKGDQAKVFGVTSPLINKSDGTKFGKTESGSVWLDANKTGPYEFYQFWLNVSDDDIIDFTKRLSFKSKEEIEALELSLKEQAHLREAQKALATEVTELVHGKEGLESAIKITNTLFGGDIKDLSFEELKDGLADAPKASIVSGLNLVDALVEAKIASSKREARELIQNGSVLVNGDKITDFDFLITAKAAFNQEMTIIRKGKKKYFVILFEN